MDIHTREGKRQFIRSLCRAVEASTLLAVPQMPDDWDGHELRLLLAQDFIWECGSLLPVTRADVPNNRFNRPDRKRRQNFMAVRYNSSL